MNQHHPQELFGEKTQGRASALPRGQAKTQLRASILRKAGIPRHNPGDLTSNESIKDDNPVNGLLQCAPQYGGGEGSAFVKELSGKTGDDKNTKISNYV